MPSPSPPVPLKDHCSVVYDGTLYTYQPDAFQSIPLSTGGRWAQLPMAVAVRGAVCVQAYGRAASDAALYVVGGATNSSMTEYPGLQRYRFADRRWEPVMPADTVAQNRRNHAAVYLNASSAILIYAGSQDTAEPRPSSQTFLVSTVPPYGVTSFVSTAPPLIRPILRAWNETHAVLVGGAPDNRRVFVFSRQAGWTDLGVVLQEPLPDADRVQAALVPGDDGSQVLQVFDLSTAPNTVRRIVLRNARGQGPAAGEAFVAIAPGPSAVNQSSDAAAVPSARRRKRDLTLANWPAYNASLAPTVTRTAYSLAQAPDGLVAVSGGNAAEALSVFDVRENRWRSGEEVWGAAALRPTASATRSASVSSTASASSSSTPASRSSTAAAPPAAASASHANGHRALVILGATLGSIFGLAALLVALMLCLRWRARRRRFVEAAHRRRASGPAGEKGDRMSFADRGASFMSQAGGFLGHGTKDSINSHSSMTIMAGQPSRRPYPTGAYGHDRRRSSYGRRNRLSRAWRRASGGGGEPPRIDWPSPATAVDEDAGPRSSGWSRYFLESGPSGMPPPAAAMAPVRPPREPPAAAVAAGAFVVPLPPRRPVGSGSSPINFSRSHSMRQQDRLLARDGHHQLAVPLQPLPPPPPPLTIPPRPRAAPADAADDSPLYIQGQEVSPSSSTGGDGGGSPTLPARPPHAHAHAHLHHVHVHDHDHGLGDAEAEAEAVAFALHATMPGSHGHGDDDGAGWSPVGRQTEWSTTSASGRGTSSLYTDSAHTSTIPREFSASAFPEVPRLRTTMAPDATTAAMLFPRSLSLDEGGSRRSGGGGAGGGGGGSVRVSGSARDGGYRPRTSVPDPSNIPPPLPWALPRPEEESGRVHSDMSWLNLGNSREEY
ncbi:MAG: hypothetical protein M1826_001228 [Phylliscum demangeonii]|nr:MAG: hypothetical protein M1826_001228 [Phylliscum demangeonii]